jgi:hypothetical protein
MNVPGSDPRQVACQSAINKSPSGSSAPMAGAAALSAHAIVGIDNILCGSNYLHTEGVWPFSRRQVARDFVDCAPAETQKIVYDTVVALFSFPGAAR